LYPFEITFGNFRDTILHLVKDQAYYKSGIISPEYQNIGKRWRGGTETGIAEAEIHR
jgi:hypothetical protein